MLTGSFLLISQSVNSQSQQRFIGCIVFRLITNHQPVSFPFCRGGGGGGGGAELMSIQMKRKLCFFLVIKSLN